MHYNVSRFYEEKGEASADIGYLIKGKDFGELSNYDPKIVRSRF